MRNFKPEDYDITRDKKGRVVGVQSINPNKRKKERNLVGGGVTTLEEDGRKFHYAQGYTTRVVPAGRKGAVGERQGGTTLQVREYIRNQKDLDKPCRGCGGTNLKTRDDKKNGIVVQQCSNQECWAKHIIHTDGGKLARPFTPETHHTTIEGPRGGKYRKIDLTRSNCSGCGGKLDSADSKRCKECRGWKAAGGTFKYKGLKALLSNIAKK